MTSCVSSDSPVLALNGAEKHIQVVIGNQENILFSKTLLADGKAMPYLVPSIQMALKELKLELGQLKGIACVRGPGSFTGIRIVLATAQGLAAGATLPLAGINYLRLLATATRDLVKDEIWAITYARKGQVNMQGFTGQEMQAICKPLYLSAQEAADYLQERSSEIYLLGSGIRQNLDIFNSIFSYSCLLPTKFDIPCPQALLSLALQADFKHQTISPLYLRKSDAEQNLPAITDKRGIPLSQAQTIIANSAYGQED